MDSDALGSGTRDSNKTMTAATVDAANVRIITTLGHVDHGKTTLMDALLAANNIISSRMAGKMRYLDSREDEQERGITMESSAVSLRFQVLDKDGKSPKVFAVNMIDTPGHVDFSSEVSTASRLCDGALVLVDVVEGVCTQTIAVLRQAWLDRLRPILVINKFDRLITELQLAPVEAYHHLARLIEQVNAVMGKFFAGDRMEDDLRWREERERRMAEKKEMYADEADAADAVEDEFQEKDDEDIYFAPERGNVVFASAIDGWGFRIGKFAQLFSSKLGMKEANLRRVLWGDFYIDPKTKKVISYKHLRGRALKPLFVQFILENIWAVYDAVVLNPNTEKITKIVGALNLKIPPRDLKSKDTRHLLSLIFSQWLSLSTCIIQAAIDVVPSPTTAQATRLPKMLYPELYDAAVQPKNKLERDLFASNSDADACVAAYVSKMFSVSAKDLPENKKKPMTAEEMRAKAREAKEARLAAAAAAEGNAAEGNATPVQTEIPTTAAPETATPDAEPAVEDAGEVEVNLGFARLYSGTISNGTSVFAVLPKYNATLGPTHPRNAKFICTVLVEGLYVMMGRELVAVESVRAGNIFAIKGLEGKVWRSATLCAPSAEGIGESPDSEIFKDCLINLGGVNRTAPPILRVALEPVKPADMPKLINGLKLLSHSDPCVETFQQQTGEYVILTAGELHFERCLKDLRERFARVEIQASKPIVPFRETAVKGIDMAPPKTPNATRGTVHAASSQNIVAFTIRASPLPSIILDFILQNLALLKNLQHGGDASVDQDSDIGESNIDGTIVRKPSVKPEEFWDALRGKCQEAGGEWVDAAECIMAFGPQNAGGCILIDARKASNSGHSSLKRRLEKNKTVEDPENNDSEFDSHIQNGFQLATFQGPLCAEPVEGMAYFVESVEINRESLAKEIEQNRMAQVTGSVISAVRDACRNGLLDWSPRLMLAMYTCDIQASTEVLGKVYGVVARRRGRIVAEEMKEGTSFFNVSAMLPVVESFGFADDIRKRTSGAASPQLIFSGYELLDQDPFWVPTTEEELEDLGEKADRSNIAKGYMDTVRERKGLFVDRKIVEFAEKQRTLKR
ncbi:P-loop containing nucleoside triphosphate hydrolase protein [Roridomyces roridus]|uniref:Ribosome assembly protein 1 n=1 Tax=Roridomyces roridus TaxID=1738132 RepID=A0AAD7CBI6_9AGAR|nr:P-loop containing nucleoside triphosphate hydrolase protein [Roridomyces roridus]